MTIKSRLLKTAGIGFKGPALAALSYLTYKTAKQAKQDYDTGRAMRKQASILNETPDIFPAASSAGGYSARTSMLDGLFSNRERMKKNAETQLSDAFPEASKQYKGKAAKSLTTAKEASSQLSNIFKSK